MSWIYVQKQTSKTKLRYSYLQNQGQQQMVNDEEPALIPERLVHGAPDFNVALLSVRKNSGQTQNVWYEDHLWYEVYHDTIRGCVCLCTTNMA